MCTVGFLPCSSFVYKDALQFVRLQLFQNGIPVQSTVALTQDLFRYAGELMAMSVLQGGPAPNFFSPAIYEVIANGLSGANLSVDMIEKSALKEIANKVIYSNKYFSATIVIF